MKERKEISGIFFRVENKETKQIENVCFEDLEEDQQREVLSRKPLSWVKSLAILLANVINNGEYV